MTILSEELFLRPIEIQAGCSLSTDRQKQRSMMKEAVSLVFVSVKAFDSIKGEFVGCFNGHEIRFLTPRVDPAGATLPMVRHNRDHCARGLSHEYLWLPCRRFS
jgi:hypothetical protein